jgi:hypothetical protein
MRPIRKDTAAKMRTWASLAKARVFESGSKEDIAREEAIRLENERVVIPYIEIRHPDEEALLRACSSRLTAIQADAEVAQQARESAIILDLWGAFQEFQSHHHHRAPRHRAKPRISLLLELGMQAGARLLGRLLRALV